MILQLTKQSTAQDIKAYFEEVLKLSKDSKEFPVNLDDVWPLVYSVRLSKVHPIPRPARPLRRFNPFGGSK